MSRKRQKTTHGNFTASNGNSYTRPPPLTLQDALSEFSEALEVAAKLGEGLMIELLMGWAEELRLKWAYMRDSRSLDKSPDQVNERQNGYRDVGHHDLSDDAMRDDGDETVSENEEENDELYEQFIDGKNNKFLHTATFKSFNIPAYTGEGLGYLLPRTKKAFELGLTARQIRAQAIELRENINVEALVGGTWNNRRWTGLAIACNGLEYLGDQQCIRCSSGAGPFKKCTYWEGNCRYRCSNCAWDNERCSWPQVMKKTRPKKFSISTSGKTSHSGPSTDATISVNDDATISVHGGRSEAGDEETGPAGNYSVQEQILDYEPMEVEHLGSEPEDNSRVETQVSESVPDPIEQAEKAFRKLPGPGTPFHTALGELYPTTLEEFQYGLTLEEMTELGIVLNVENWPPGYVWKDAAWRALAIALEGDVMEGEDACDICKSGKGRFAECYVWKQQTSRCASCMIRKKMCKEPFVPKDQRPSTGDSGTPETLSTRGSISARDPELIQEAEDFHKPEPIQRSVTAQKPQVIERSEPIHEADPVQESVPIEETGAQLSTEFEESGGSELEPEHMELDNVDFSNRTMSPAGDTPAQATPHFTMLDKYLDPYDIEEMDQYASPEDALMDQEEEVEEVEEAASVFNTAYNPVNTEEVEDVSVPVSPGQRNGDDNTPEQAYRLVLPDASTTQGHMNKTGQSTRASNTPIDLPLVRLGDIEDEESEYDEYSDSGDEVEAAVGDGIGGELVRHLTASLSGSTASSHVSSPAQTQLPVNPWAPSSAHSHLPELLEMDNEPKIREPKAQRSAEGTSQAAVVRKPLGRPRKDRQKERHQQEQNPSGKPQRQHPRRERRPAQKVGSKLNQPQKEQPPAPAAPAIKITTRVRPSLIISFKYNPHALLSAKSAVKPPTKPARAAPTKGAFTSSIERHKITTSAPSTARPATSVPKLPQLNIPPPTVLPTAPPRKPVKATFSTNPTNQNGATSGPIEPPKRIGRPPKKNKFYGRRPGAPAPPTNPAPPTRVAPPAPGPINAANSRRIAVPAPPTPTTQPAAPRKLAPPAPPPLTIPQPPTFNNPIVIKSSPIEPTPIAAPDATPIQGPTHIPISQMLAEGISLRSSAFTPADALEWCPQKWRAYKIAKHGTFKTGEKACLRCQSGSGRFGKCYFWDGKYQACSTCSWQKASCVFAPGHAPG